MDNQEKWRSAILVGALTGTVAAITSQVVFRAIDWVFPRSAADKGDESESGNGNGSGSADDALPKQPADPEVLQPWGPEFKEQEDWPTEPGPAPFERFRLDTAYFAPG